MLSTAGLVPVAQEFCGAAMPGLRGSEFSPVSEECPSTMMPRSGCDAEVVRLGGLAGAVLVAVDVAVSPPQPAARTARTTANTQGVILVVRGMIPLSRRSNSRSTLGPPAAGCIRVTRTRALWLATVRWLSDRATTA